MCRLDKLYVKEGSISPDKAYIKTFTGEIIRFNKDGKLIAIEKENKKTEIYYNNYGISYIIDSTGKGFEFLYNTDGFVNEIKAYNKIENPIHIKLNNTKSLYKTEYNYTTDGKLESVTFPGTEVVKYEYSKDKLIAVTGLDGNKYLIDYINKKVKSLNQFSNINKMQRNIVYYSKNGNCVTKSSIFGDKYYNYNDYGLIEMDSQYKAD